MISLNTKGWQKLFVFNKNSIYVYIYIIKYMIYIHVHFKLPWIFVKYLFITIYKIKYSRTQIDYCKTKNHNISVYKYFLTPLIYMYMYMCVSLASPHSWYNWTKTNTELHKLCLWQFYWRSEMCQNLKILFSIIKLTTSSSLSILEILIWLIIKYII